MHQWECILKKIQYQMPRAKQVAWTFSLTNRLKLRCFFSFPAMFWAVNYREIALYSTMKTTITRLYRFY